MVALCGHETERVSLQNVLAGAGFLKEPRILAFRVTEVIHRPVNEVWAYLSDLSNAPYWMRGIADVAPLTAGPIGEGTVFKTALSSRKKREQKIAIVQFVPFQTLTLASREGGITAIYQYTLETDAGFTTVTLDAECFGDNFAWRLLKHPVSAGLKWADQGQLRQLKAQIEGEQ